MFNLNIATVTYLHHLQHILDEIFRQMWAELTEWDDSELDSQNWK